MEQTMAFQKQQDVEQITARVRHNLKRWGITVSFLAEQLGVSRQYAGRQFTIARIRGESGGDRTDCRYDYCAAEAHALVRRTAARGADRFRIYAETGRGDDRVLVGRC
jgi:hypothetical protein